MRSANTELDSFDRSVQYVLKQGTTADELIEAPPQELYVTKRVGHYRVLL